MFIADNEFEILLIELQEYLKNNFKPDIIAEEDYEISKDEKNDLEIEIHQLLENMDTSFSERLLEIIRERNIQESKVYKKAYIDRRHFEKIKNRKKFNPTKITIIMLCLALELSFEESCELYKRAGYCFSNSFKVDVIGRFFLEKKVYDVYRFREALYKCGVLKDS